MGYQTIVTEIDDGVLTVTLNRPAALNALSSELWRELVAALDKAEGDPAIRCTIITGSDRAFAAGADVAEMATKSYAEMARTDYLSAEADRFARLRKPVIAAVAGYALGGGCELAMMCDIVIAADTARFGQPEITLGIIAGLGGTQRLTRAVGKAVAMDMHLTGRLLSAAEALDFGLVARVVPVADLAATARAVARSIAEKPRIATLAAKESVNRAFETPLSEGLLHERRLFQALFATRDQKEGMAAFLEKRRPEFRDE